LFVPDHCRPFAERQEWGHRRRFWRPGEPDGIWSAWRRYRSDQGHDLVRHYFYGDFDHVVGGRVAEVRAWIGAAE